VTRDPPGFQAVPGRERVRRLEYGLGLEPGNRKALEACDRHHALKAVAEPVAGGSITLGRF
jgi:hypothetical protein